MPPVLTILLLLLALACFVSVILKVPGVDPLRALAAGFAVWVLVQILALIFHSTV